MNVMSLKKHQKYLQIALNSTIKEAEKIISQIPLQERILIEAGTPLIKSYGAEAIKKIRFFWQQRILGYAFADSETFQVQSGKFLSFGLFKKLLEEKMIQGLKQKRKPAENQKNSFALSGVRACGASVAKDDLLLTGLAPYIIADIKCADLAQREVEMSAEAGANAVTCLGAAPIETIDIFIEECAKLGVDSMIDMMNVENPSAVLEKIKTPPKVVILHRGVDEETFNPEKEIPFHQIQIIKSNYDILVSIAGGDNFQEVQRAIFNDADIVVVWKSFYKSTAQTTELAEQFLREIR